jgi:uncharacterized protein with ParB-like and HNH nuclease domain
MSKNEVNELELLSIPELMGKNFFIPDYQRGYRWEKIHIFQLLSDIWDFSNNSSGEFYCLQPIVIKECNEEVREKYKLNSEYDNNRWFEVIDGQQRLTTIRLIIQMNNIISPISKVENCFNLFYETRPELKDIFTKLNIANIDNDIEVNIDKTSIDSCFITSGLKYIVNWFCLPGENYEKRATLQQFPLFFSVFFAEKSSNSTQRQGKSTQVIWYVVNQNSDENDFGMEGTDAKTIFNRLNDTKIPLSNSELIKAMFLSQDSKYELDYNSERIEDEDAKKFSKKIDKAKKQNHIAKQLDLIEHSLGNSRLWNFATNREIKSYDTKIELLYDLISEKYTKNDRNSELNKKDNLYTFLFFDKLVRKGEDLWDLWMLVEQYFETICYWFENRELYHKIGYLVCISDDTILIDLLSKAVNQNKKEFIKNLDKIIFDSVNFDLAKINYKENYEEIQRLLILYNIETVRKLDNVEYYPFHLHKEKNWTLEHIHAQNSDNLSKDDQNSWFIWLDEHIAVITSLIGVEYILEENKNELNSIIQSLKAIRANKKLDFSTFLNEFNRVIKFFDVLNNLNGDTNSVHLLSNMALLGGIENSILSNSIFEAKRKEILKMDAEGKYIPLSTRYVFLKYHNLNEDNFSNQQLYFWGVKDRTNYLSHIKEIMSEYYPSDMLSPIS